MKNYYLFVKLQHINCASLYRKPDMSTRTKQPDIYHFFVVEVFIMHMYIVCLLY